MPKKPIAAVTLCVGAPLLAFGVGTATARADATQETNATVGLAKTTSTKPIAAKGGIAISVGNVKILQTGSSSATAVGPNIAIAVNNSHAEAYGIGTIAIAVNNSVAGTTGIFSTAIASDNSHANAGPIDGNQAYSRPQWGNKAIATNGSWATASEGRNNIVTATNNSQAWAINASNNTVIASDGSNGGIEFGSGNLVTARCGGSALIEGNPGAPYTNQTFTDAPC